MSSEKPELQKLIDALGLQPLPVEGGLFRQTYQAPEKLPPGENEAPGIGRGTPIATAILYLLTSQPDSFSALHRLPNDEIWHFYLGDPLEMTLLYQNGSTRQVILGQDILKGEQVQFLVPRDVWQGTRLIGGGEYALVGTTNAPGYTKEGYEGGKRNALLKLYPEAREHIIALTRAGG